ncbi:MAG: hypothetical protein ACR2G6_07395 [Gemmatimonadaceae bacterium]
MVAQFQTEPTPDAACEIILLAKEIQPAPAIPAVADRHMQRGIAAFKDATAPADYMDAAKEFELATLAAPWYGDAYYNRGVALDKARQPAIALGVLKFAQLILPESREVQSLIDQVQWRVEKQQREDADFNHSLLLNFTRRCR